MTANNPLRKVKFTCDPALIDRLDSYRNRHTSRTQLLESAISHYLESLGRGEGEHRRWLET